MEKSWKTRLGNILKTIQEIENSGLWGMFPVRISIQMGGRTVIVDLISFHNLLHCAIPFFLLRESPENYKLQGWLWRWRNIPKSIAEILGGKYGEILVGGHTSSSPPWASASTAEPSLLGTGLGPKQQTAPNKTDTHAAHPRDEHHSSTVNSNQCATHIFLFLNLSNTTVQQQFFLLKNVQHPQH